MIEMRRKQLSFGDGLIADEVSDLRESWMAQADAALADEEIVAIVYIVEQPSALRPRRTRGGAGRCRSVTLKRPNLALPCNGTVPGIHSSSMQRARMSSVGDL
jgi:hypothetical protein